MHDNHWVLMLVMVIRCRVSAAYDRSDNGVIVGIRIFRVKGLGIIVEILIFRGSGLGLGIIIWILIFRA